MGNNQTKANNSAPSEAQAITFSQQNKPESYKINPILKSPVTWRCLTPYDVNYINKYKPKMISHVTLTNLHSLMAGPRNIRKLRKTLVHSKEISSIRIDKLNVSSEQLVFLLHSTNRWKKFSFSFTTPEQFTEVISRLGRCKNLTVFPLGFQRLEIPILQNVNTEMFESIWRQLRQLNKLEDLVLDIALYNGAVLQNYKPPGSLQSLHLNFQNKIGFSQKDLSRFLTNFQQLEGLWLSFSQVYRIEYPDVQIWTSFFENASNSLKKLTISLLFHPQQQPEEMQSLMESLKNLKNLTSFNLAFLGSLPENHPLLSSDSFFPTLLTTLQSMTQLEELRLNFACFPTFKSADFQHLALVLQHLKNLKNLNINLASLQSPNEDFFALSESLRQLKNIQIIDIKFANKNLTQSSLEIFSSNIAHLNLTSLSLNHNKISHDMVIPIAPSSLEKLIGFWRRSTLIPFFSNIGSFTELSCLNIRLAGYEISLKEYNYLAIELSQLTKLSSLCLNLPRFDSANKFESLQSLVSCFKDLSKLTDLSLTFEEQICDGQVRILSESFIGCKSLKSLSLTFDSASQLHDISLYCLLYGIRHLSDLCILNIDFGKCEIFGVIGVVESLNGLTVLKELSWINFHFNSAFLRHRFGLLPVDLKGFYKMKKLRHFVAGPSDFI